MYHWFSYCCCSNSYNIMQNIFGFNGSWTNDNNNQYLTRVTPSVTHDCYQLRPCYQTCRQYVVACYQKIYHNKFSSIKIVTCIQWWETGNLMWASLPKYMYIENIVMLHCSCGCWARKQLELQIVVVLHIYLLIYYCTYIHVHVFTSGYNKYNRPYAYDKWRPIYYSVIFMKISLASLVAA